MFLVHSGVLLSYLCLVVFVFSQCEKPQKAAYISYNAMSKLDTMSKLFQQINIKNKAWNFTFHKVDTYYTLTNFVPHFYHNQHYQVEKYHNNESIEVQLGKIHMAYSFNYSVIKGVEKREGHGNGRVDIVAPLFVKLLELKNDSLHWRLKSGTPLQFADNLTIDYSEPKLTYDEKEQFESEQMLNSELHQNQILQYWNDQFTNGITKHLSEFKQFTNAPQIIYSFNHQSYTFNNHIKSFQLLQSKDKGLFIYFNFGFKTNNPSCVDSDISFNNSYGGMQQIYFLSAFQDAFKQHVQNGLMDFKLDKTWNVRSFQFFMGDLSGSIPQANKYDPQAPITTECKVNQSRAPLLNIYDHQQLYAEIEYTCNIVFNSSAIIEMQLPLSIIVRMNLMQNYMRLKVANVTFESKKLKLKSVNPNFEIQNQSLLQFQMRQVLYGLIGRQSFLSNWKTVTRKFPVAIGEKGQIELFDFSEK